jgi:hypothetical protein
MQEKSTANPNSDVEPAAYAGLLERLLTSPQLKRSARLRELLTYIWRRSVQDHCDQIHEQKIGTRVFGRQPDLRASRNQVPVCSPAGYQSTRAERTSLQNALTAQLHRYADGNSHARMPAVV